MKNIRLADLFDMSLIQKLADSNFRAVGVPMRVVDAHDSTELVSAGESDLCAKFHCDNKKSKSYCSESFSCTNVYPTSEEDIIYKCNNGLWHAAIPITVFGSHVATIFFSHFFIETEAPDREFFLRQAARYGYDSRSYMAALDCIPIFSEERFKYILAFNKALARLISDIAEQALVNIRTKRSLSASEEKYRQLVENIGVGIYRDIPDENSRLNKCNPAFAELFGFVSAEECMRTLSVSLFFNPSDRKALIEDTRLNGFAKKRILMKKKDGSLMWCSITATASYGEDCELKWIDAVVEDITESVVAKYKLETELNDLEILIRERTADLALANEMLVAEIAERKKAEAMLRELSEKDYLTMIYNRRKFFDTLRLEIEKAKRYNRPLSLIIFDIDHFKEINDKYGHIAGDAILKAFAALVESLIRKNDLFARYGGEEFVILSPETEINGAVAIAEKIRETVNRSVFDYGANITVSAGVTQWTPGDSEISFIARADKMMYIAKNQGRNRVVSSDKFETEKCETERKISLDER